MLNPMDFLLWLSEEMETRDWDSNLVGTQIGLSFNFVFLLARANSAGPPLATISLLKTTVRVGCRFW